MPSPSHLDPSTLRPYKSVLLLDSSEVVDAKRLTSIRQAVVEKVQDNTVVLAGVLESFDDGELTTTGIHLIERVPVNWSADEAIVDVVNHLVLVCGRGHRLAAFFSEPRLRDVFMHAVEFKEGEFVGLTQLTRKSLSSAFLSGPMRTVWLSGTHRSTSLKADSKVLTGSDLRDALDPIGDQSYAYSAARSHVDIGPRPVPIGVAPRSSRIWIGPSRDWSDFRQSVVDLFDRLNSPKGVAGQLSILAEPIDQPAMSAPFDMIIAPPELESLDIDDPQLQADIEAALSTQFVIQPGGVGDRFRAEVIESGLRLGTVQLELNFKGDKVKVLATPSPSSSSTQERLKRIATTIARPGHVKVWFESGHTLTDGRVYEMKFRDVPFHGFQWGDFAKYDVTKEKPAKGDLNQIGKENSLFCWVTKEWPLRLSNSGRPGKGWLICDDGAGEICDFVHFDDAGISLIHAKGAKSSSVTREISVADYEVVSSQAVKNLRSVDGELLLERLDERARRAGARGSKLRIWRDGKPGKWPDARKALKKLVNDARRRVVLLQPGVREASYKTPTRREEYRLKQLKTLLVGVENNCRSLGAEFVVIGDGTPASVLVRRTRSPAVAAKSVTKKK